MDFNATIDLIIKDLKEAGDIIDDLKKYPGVPALQVELAKLKCRSAGECIAILKTLRETSSFSEQEPSIPIQNEPVLREKQQKEFIIAEKVEKVTIIHEDIKQEPLLPEEKNISVSETGSVPEPVIEPVPEENMVEIITATRLKEPERKKTPAKEQESPILADKFSNVTNTFHDKLGSINSEDDLTLVLQSQPIDSLLNAIGINDKFLFIREIFKGNQVEYHQAISRLENAENMTDAKAVIMSYTGENNENDAVRQLLDLVKRKLPAHE